MPTPKAMSALQRWVALCALCLAAACSQREGKLTEVVVTIDADEAVAMRLNEIEIATYDADATDPRPKPVTSGRLTLKPGSAPGTAQFPFSVGVSKTKADRFLLVVTGYAGGEAVIEQKAYVGFVDNELRGLGVYLSSPCYQHLCGKLDSSDWLKSTCTVRDGAFACVDVEMRDTSRVVVGQELEAGLAVPAAISEMDDAGAGASSDASSDASSASDAARDAAPAADVASPASDYALGTVGGSCAASQNQQLACEGHESRKVLICNQGTWNLFQTCPVDQRCDSRVGAGQGLCASIPSQCAGKAPGDVCDGKARKSCGVDLVSLTDNACPANAHCDDSGGATRCACDTGFDDVGQGVCANHNDCPAGACVGGSCVDGVDDYSCNCESGFTGTGTKTCTAVRYCPKDACAPGGTCVDAPTWSCHCNAGFAGEGTQACTNINDCPTDRCKAPNGTCQDGVNTYTCVCNDGFSGPDCATDVCASLSCGHGGVCTRAAQGASCDCGSSGYTGAKCELDINECATTNLCTSADYPCVQTAPPGYTCQGQFADWHMPDALAGSKFAPSYDTSTAGIVVDKVTGLVWQRDLPATYTGCSGNSAMAGDSCTWAEAKNYCKGLPLAGGGWRLPTKIELESIIDETVVNLAINQAVFPGTPTEYFWTASPYVGSSGSAWVVNFVTFFGGFSDYAGTSGAYRVRCVR